MDTRRLMCAKFASDHDDYRRIRMLQNLLFVAINGGFSGDPLVVDLTANFTDCEDRVALIAGLKAELWATINDVLPSTDPKPIDAVTPTGTWSLADIMALNN